MKVFVVEDYTALSKQAAQIIKQQIAAKPESILGLATGSTPIGTYEELARMHAVGEINFSGVTTFNLDEYHPIQKTSDQSYDFYMKKNFFYKVNLLDSRTNIPNGEAADYAAECAAYEEKIIAAGGIDLQLLGIGNNGHLGFNEPNDFFTAETFYAALDESTIEANARFFASADEVPRHAVTVGMRTIMSAKKILLIASGGGKAQAVCEALLGHVTPKNPASILQLHSNVTIVLDKNAGSLFSKCKNTMRNTC
ncbi:MAG: glucosamine-6-phosphate deaminase [Defluviitaleaceae bacterium]|nr:glucosamine-6-phosphate deaminase [Defluviitaleaceae bacterium]